TDPGVYEPLIGPARAPGLIQTMRQTGRALVVFLDLPLLTGDETPYEPYAATTADPWPGQIALLKSATTSNYTLDTALTRQSVIGETLGDLFSGPPWRWDRVN